MDSLRNITRREGRGGAWQLGVIMTGKFTIRGVIHMCNLLERSHFDRRFCYLAKHNRITDKTFAS